MNMKLNEYLEFLEAKGISLADIGIYETAFNRIDAISAISLLREAEVAVLGGDVYKKQGNKIVSTFDNWYCERNKYKSEKDYINKSLEIAENYVANYKNGDSDQILFTLVIPE